MVEAEIRQRLEEMVRRMMQQGIDPKKAEIDWKPRCERGSTSRPDCPFTRRLLLDEIAKKAGMEVDSAEELDDADRPGCGPDGSQKLDVAKEQLRQQRWRDTKPLRSQLLREKALDLIASVANIKNRGVTTMPLVPMVVEQTSRGRARLRHLFEAAQGQHHLYRSGDR